MTANPVWIIMPVLSNPEMTLAAISDCLAQSVPTRLLIVLQGVHGPFRDQIEQLAEQEPAILVWSHDPSLPSLSATWNRALQFVWAAGGTEALVMNNDVRLHVDMVNVLKVTRMVEDALFVSAVGVTAEQFAEIQDKTEAQLVEHLGQTVQKGGPDFSCFLISKEGHEKYPFDEAFIPAFCEDLDMHRRYMLGGDGERIFSINLPFLHFGGGSQTIKSLDDPARAKLTRAIEAGSRRHYEQKWGGPVNAERWTIPFDSETDQDGVTTPDLQRMVQGVAHVPTN